MAITLYEITVPVMVKSMKIIQTLLIKGAEHVKAVGGDEDKLVDIKLVDDMGGLAFQIQRISDSAKGFAVRIGAVEPVSMADDEKTMTDLQERLEKTIKLLESINEEKMNGAESKEVIVPSKAAGDLHYTGKSYALEWALPNFNFHFVTAYALLRKEGVPVGKMDFLGRPGKSAQS